MWLDEHDLLWRWNKLPIPEPRQQLKILEDYVDKEKLAFEYTHLDDEAENSIGVLKHFAQCADPLQFQTPDRFACLDAPRGNDATPVRNPCQGRPRPCVGPFCNECACVAHGVKIQKPSQAPDDWVILCSLCSEWYMLPMPQTIECLCCYYKKHGIAFP